MSSTPVGNFPADYTHQIQSISDSFAPYDHQKLAWDRLTRHFLEQDQRAGLVIVPTGGGKTLIAARWLLQNVVAKGGRVLWLTHRRSSPRCPAPWLGYPMNWCWTPTS